MEDKKSYLQNLTDQLHQWDVEIDELNARAGKTNAEARTEHLNEIEDLRAKKDAAQSQMKQLQAAGDDKWNDMKAGVEKSWTELTDAFASAFAKFAYDELS
ncbi:MAG: coiled coil domain-containing protein [Anaerolineae bacterium]|nr:coiled coil domain-containing protein [Anaerolineae bacterium]MCI0699119.1 coiled coil domain-containing protein [candidate division KSB1 bacterium]